MKAERVKHTQLRLGAGLYARAGLCRLIEYEAKE